jgi:hypothetical protein
MIMGSLLLPSSGAEARAPTFAHIAPISVAICRRCHGQERRIAPSFPMVERGITTNNNGEQVLFPFVSTSTA